MEDRQLHPMRIVTRRTGLSHHVIRVWERRYAAVTPKRTETNRRMYTDDDIERLNLLRRAIQAGRSIGDIANQSTDSLRELILADEKLGAGTDESTFGGGKSPDYMLETCMAKVKQLDSESFEKALLHASIVLSQPVLLQKVIAPLIQQIGDAWRDGEIRIVHEHLATAVIRTFLGNMGTSFETDETAPEIIVATPSRQLHELGALLAAITAASEGWRVNYLGPNLPVEELAEATRTNEAKAIALSIVYPGDDARLFEELNRLKQLLDKKVLILAGGRVARNYAKVITSLGGKIVSDMPSFRKELEAIRN